MERRGGSIVMGFRARNLQPPTGHELKVCTDFDVSVSTVADDAVVGVSGRDVNLNFVKLHLSYVRTNPQLIEPLIS
jgi:hypothetical protein